ncbi:hypothetical protein ZIOFF_004829 [Zingiber officinale]|uniref:Phosphatidylinositol N-acetylglucosaminyltransferase subunit H conserved domain-containing protein n=1 Tax=Zingiber officinale TaxID=94328 RepID=A0A8J5LRA3_ZINOF|nr:hypothetical protein ZIOFF_004829 [Zingiber officinale]
MSEAPIFHSKYSYHHDGKAQQLDIHEILVKRSRLGIFLSYFMVVVFLGTNVYFVTTKVFCILILTFFEVNIRSIWSILVCFLLAKFLHYNPVKKERVVIMPAFGVQLETHYWSGRIVRLFVPISKILSSMLNECVTPVTCYWSLALLLRDEGELMLVFQLIRFVQKLQPPLKMLVPVWKALRAAINCEETSIT